MGLSRKTATLTVSLIALLAVLLVGLGLVLRPDQYQAVAGGIQAFAVVVALSFAAATLLSDSRDRRVDRVLQLHQSMTSGEVDAARQRLSEHLWRHGRPIGRARDVSLDELDSDTQLSRYEGTASNFSPREDARTVLRLMERANFARLGGAVDEQLLHELIGRHAVWYAVAIGRDPTASSPHLLHALLDLAQWADEYQEDHLDPTRYYMRTWGQARMRAFNRTSWRDPQDE